MPDEIEIIDHLNTKVVSAIDLDPGSYVFLPDGVEDDETVPTLVTSQTGEPVLWRVAGWFTDDDEEFLRLDGPGEVIEMPLTEDDMVRLILPGQDHETWPPQA